MPSATLVKLRKGRFARILLWVNRGLALLVVSILAVTCWVVYNQVKDDRDAAPPGASHGEPSYADLEIFDNAGRFGGTVTIHNPLDRDVEVLVEVDIYNGEQNVGDVTGMVSLKPESGSGVELDGFDEFVDYTDTRVHLTGLPK